MSYHLFPVSPEYNTCALFYRQKRRTKDNGGHERSKRQKLELGERSSKSKHKKKKKKKDKKKEKESVKNKTSSSTSSSQQEPSNTSNRKHEKTNIDAQASKSNHEKRKRTNQNAIEDSTGNIDRSGDGNQTTSDDRTFYNPAWSVNIPLLALEKIFSHVIEGTGAVPLLCR